jgi:hypothetical protein
MPPNRHVPFKKEGWGAAIITSIATIAVFLTAWAIHERTYRHPTDVMMRQMGGEAGHGEGGHAPSAPANAGGQTGGHGGAGHGAAGGDAGAAKAAH